MSKPSKTFLLGRKAGSGVFVSVSEARKHPNTTVVERIPKRGYGDTGRSKKR